ncbi:MAG TPA: hypothetical protein VNU97_19105 [Rhizomicrobium sp.]|jgi:hypothetical protein|nr:hypothetical protein [Rhizomicrobium sp.]
MTKMDLAIKKLRALPLKRQAELADYLIDLAEEERRPSYRLTDEQLAEVRLAQQEVAEGKVASKEEMDAFWRRAGLST